MPSVNTKEKQAGLSLPRTEKHDVRSVDSFTRPLEFGGKVHLHKMCKQCFREGRSPAKSTINHGIDESGHVADNEPDDTICAATSTHRFGRKTITLSHHVFSNGSGWKQRHSLPQPTVPLLAYVCSTDYKHFGLSLSSYPQGGQVTTIAHTGCQSCLIGLKLACRLGFKQTDRIPVEHKMSAANK